MKSIIILYSFVLSLLLLTNCSNEQKSEQDAKIYGVKIYEYEGNLNSLFESWDNYGINTVFASTDLLSVEEFKSLAKDFGIKTFAILPIFFAPEELEKDSTLFAITQFGNHAESEWVQFVCPSAENFRQSKIEFITDFVTEHAPDGISLDFIRHFAYWEKVYPNTDFDELPNTCFDKRCISKFSNDLNIGLPSDVSSEMEIYEWIREHHFEKWIQWKSNLITEMVREIVYEVKKINPTIMVNLHAVPWRQNDFDGAINKIAGQDFHALSQYVDYLSPMTYSHMVKRKPQWIHSVVRDISGKSNARIIPSIQVGIAYLNDTLTAEEFEQCIVESLKDPSNGVVFWNWEALVAEKEKLALLKSILN